MGFVVRTISISIVFLIGGYALAASPIDPDEARPQIRWEDAGFFVDRIVFVHGKIVGVNCTERLCFVNFDSSRPAKFVAVIYKDDLRGFPDSPESLYVGKNVRIRGTVTTYQGKPQIVLRSPQQVAVVDVLPELKPFSPVERKVSGDAFTIGTYNVLNLFDDVDDPYSLDEGTPAKPKDEMRRLAETIRKLDADVLALQEVENRSYLERFIEVFLGDMGYKYVVHFEGNDPRGIDVALISRIPIGHVVSHRHLKFPDEAKAPIAFERDILAVEIVPPVGESFEVWVLHLKSNYEGRDYAEPIRKSEAAYVRKMLDDRFTRDAGARIVVCGDFNDVWESPTLKTIAGTDSKAMRAFVDDLPPDNRVTYNKAPHLTMIDFLLASPAFAENYVKGSYRVIPGTIESSGSDHNPVSARFTASQKKSAVSGK